MISEKRLKELVKERKDFFEASIYDDVPRKINIKEIDISKPFVFYDDENGNAERVFYNLLSGQLCSVDLERIFETEEDARWELEMTATRTETLKLPKFEQITSNKDDIETRVVGFYVDRIYYILEYASDLDGNWRICLEKDTIEDCECLFEAEPTKENYLKACKMAKKLFLGEGEEV